MGRGAAPYRGATGLPLPLVLTLALALALPLPLAQTPRRNLPYISPTSPPHLPHTPQAERASCEIDQRTELGEEEFYRDYYLPARPVLLRGVMPLSDRCKFAKAAPTQPKPYPYPYPCPCPYPHPCPYPCPTPNSGGARDGRDAP